MFINSLFWPIEVNIAYINVQLKKYHWILKNDFDAEIKNWRVNSYLFPQ